MCTRAAALFEGISQRGLTILQLSQGMIDRDLAADHGQQCELQRRGLRIEALLKQVRLFRGLFQLAELRKLRDKFGIVGGFQRILVFQLCDEKFQKIILSQLSSSGCLRCRWCSRRRSDL